MQCIAPESCRGPRSSADRGLVGYTAQTGSCVRVVDQHKHPSFDPQMDKTLVGRGKRLLNFNDHNLIKMSRMSW